MKLQKCPHCRQSQPLVKLLFLTAHNRKRCHHCGNDFKVNHLGSLPFLLFVIVPFSFINSFAFQVNPLYFLLAFLWAVVSTIIYLKHVPLEKFDKQ